MTRHVTRPQATEESPAADDVARLSLLTVREFVFIYCSVSTVRHTSECISILTSPKARSEHREVAINYSEEEDLRKLSNVGNFVTPFLFYPLVTWKFS